MDDELFRGGGLRNEPAMLGRERQRESKETRERECGREREREFSFPLSLSLHVEDGDPRKNLPLIVLMRVTANLPK